LEGGCGGEQGLPGGVLPPDHAYYDGRPNREMGHGDFFSDAYRVAANIGLDFEWFAASEWERENAGRIQRFFADKEASDLRRYAISGVRRYYDDCLYFFAFLALSGNYRIWRPRVGG